MRYGYLVMTEAEYLSGRLLLAMPDMFDPNFERAVIAMCVHDENGALGIGVGQLRDDISLHGLLEQLEIEPDRVPDCPIHYGGPVEPGRGFVLHSADWGGEGTLLVNPFGALSGSVDVLRAIAQGRGPRQWMVALGYAGWGPSQLEQEMRRPGWYAATGRKTIVYDTPAQDSWNATWAAEGINPSMLAGGGGNA